MPSPSGLLGKAATEPRQISAIGTKIGENACQTLGSLP